MAETITHNHTTCKSIQQLHDITTRHQIAIKDIQATLKTQQQDITDIKSAIIDIRTSINHIIHSVSEIATKLGFEITLPPLLPLPPTSPTPLPVAAAIINTTSSASRRPVPTSIMSPYAASFDIDSTANQSNKSFVLGTGGFGTLPCLPTSPSKTAPSSSTSIFSLSHSDITSPLAHCFIFLPKNGLHYQPEVYYSRATLFKALCARQKISCHIELKENNAHNVFVEMKKLKRKWAAATTVFVEMNKMKYESKVIIFDPGGTFIIECIFDLEDKVIFEGSVMIRHCHTGCSPSPWAAASFGKDINIVYNLHLKIRAAVITNLFY